MTSSTLVTYVKKKPNSNKFSTEKQPVKTSFERYLQSHLLIRTEIQKETPIQSSVMTLKL